jgi:hypothetical protein
VADGWRVRRETWGRVQGLPKRRAATATRWPPAEGYEYDLLPRVFAIDSLR